MPLRPGGPVPARFFDVSVRPFCGPGRQREPLAPAHPPRAGTHLIPASGRRQPDAASRPSELPIEANRRKQQLATDFESKKRQQRQTSIPESSPRASPPRLVSVSQGVPTDRRRRGVRWQSDSGDTALAWNEAMVSVPWRLTPAHRFQKAPSPLTLCRRISR